MAEIWINKVFEIGGETFEIDYATYRQLNDLALIFYRVFGYEVEAGHDFYESSHPLENTMFRLALESYAYNVMVGLD